MKIAFVALPRPEDTHTSRIAPPLPLGYIAAMLEQRRHIVRIYDLALAKKATLADALAPLRMFRPHLVVIASDSTPAMSRVEAALNGCGATTMRLGTALREPAPGHAVAQALWYIDEQSSGINDQSVIFEALLALDDDLDSLPFPARHLLPLEQYPLFTIDGELQTTVITAQHITGSYTLPRQPAQIIAEVQSVMREHGIRHFAFSGPPLTNDLAWLHNLLHQFAATAPAPCWEANVRYECLNPELLRMFKRAGCEILCFEFAAGDVLVSRTERAALSAMTQQAHDLGIAVRAHIQLDPPYDVMPSLIDISATLGLNTVSFHLPRSNNLDHSRIVGNDPSLDEVEEMARSRYRSSRSRQFFVKRFGPQLGPVLWRVGRSGLLGRTWRQYADGGEDSAFAY